MISGFTGTVSVGGTTVNILGTNNSYTGLTQIQSGTLTFNSIRNVGVGNNSSLGAPTTTINGTIGFGNGGNNIGLTYTGTTAAQTWANGGSYLWEINSATGTAGSDPGWDLENGTATLNITPVDSSEFNILVTSLTLLNAAGNAANFANLTSYNWLIADFNAITGFSADAFNINTTGFSNTFTGTFGISLGGVGVVPGDNSQIYLTYTAVPEPGAALLGGLGLLALLRRRRA